MLAVEGESDRLMEHLDYMTEVGYFEMQHVDDQTAQEMGAEALRV
jgi:hypothetical protein